MSKVFGKEPSMNLYKMILELKDLDECYKIFPGSLHRVRAACHGAAL